LHPCKSSLLGLKEENINAFLSSVDDLNQNQAIVSDSKLKPLDRFLKDDLRFVFVKDPSGDGYIISPSQMRVLALCRGIARGLEKLHSIHIAHGALSSSALLTDGNEIRLVGRKDMDDKYIHIRNAPPEAALFVAKRTSSAELVEKKMLSKSGDLWSIGTIMLDIACGGRIHSLYRDLGARQIASLLIKGKNHSPCEEWKRIFAFDKFVWNVPLRFCNLQNCFVLDPKERWRLGNTSIMIDRINKEIKKDIANVKESMDVLQIDYIGRRVRGDITGSIFPTETGKFELTRSPPPSALLTAKEDFAGSLVSSALVGALRIATDKLLLDPKHTLNCMFSTSGAVAAKNPPARHKPGSKKFEATSSASQTLADVVLPAMNENRRNTISRVDGIHKLKGMMSNSRPKARSWSSDGKRHDIYLDVSSWLQHGRRGERYQAGEGTVSNTVRVSL